VEEKLKLLITHFEEEKAFLQQQIDEALSESEFLTAHRIQKGLRIADEKLRFLKSIQDPNSEKKDGLCKMRDRFQAFLSNISNEFEAALMSREIQSIEQRLEVLNKEPLPVLREGIGLLKKYFLGLIEGELEKLELYLQYQEEIIIGLEKSESYLQISVKIDPPEKSEEKFRIEYWKKDLKRLGFETSENGSLGIVLPLDVHIADSSSAVEHLLTRIYFEVCRFQGINGNAFLKIIQKHPGQDQNT
jgi:hypothetical protein